MRRLVALCVAVIAVLAPGRWLDAAQGRFRISVEVVEVDVSVTRGGASVGGLSAGSFLVTDNGVVQDVTAALLGSVPLRVTLALDVSRSVAGSRLSSLIKASTTLVNMLRPEDQASLITFSHQVMLRVPMGHGSAEITSTLVGLSGEGATALRDAVYLALATPSDERTRGVLLLFSDGFDTASFVAEEQVIAMARQGNWLVHVVHVQRDRFLARLAEVTGGRTWSAGSDRQLEELFRLVLDEIRSRYLLTYSPSGPQKPGWHELKVSLKGVRGDVIAKQGYFVP